MIVLDFDSDHLEQFLYYSIILKLMDLCIGKKDPFARQRNCGGSPFPTMYTDSHHHWARVVGSIGGKTMVQFSVWCSDSLETVLGSNGASRVSHRPVNSGWTSIRSRVYGALSATYLTLLIRQGRGERCPGFWIWILESGYWSQPTCLGEMLEGTHSTYVHTVLVYSTYVRMTIKARDSRSPSMSDDEVIWSMHDGCTWVYGLLLWLLSPARKAWQCSLSSTNKARHENCQQDRSPCPYFVDTAEALLQVSQHRIRSGWWRIVLMQTPRFRYIGHKQMCYWLSNDSSSRKE